MKPTHPLVILFGAGATRAGLSKITPAPPLDADFFDIAARITGRGTRRLARRVMVDVFAVYGRVSGIGLEQYYRDIETRGELGAFAKTRNKPRDWQLRKKNLEELVRRILIHTTCDLGGGPATPHASELHRRLLRPIKAGDTLVTFNYDTIIEEAVEAANAVWTPRTGYGVSATGVTLDWASRWFETRNIKKTSKATVQLLKLHGSINWVLYKSGAVRLKPRPYVVRSRRFENIAILPPGWHKRVDRKPYSEIWQKARLKLENCAALAVVGYSLPDTDLLARALFSEVSRVRAARGHFLKELHVADISDTVKRRIVELFVPALGSKGMVFRYGDASELAQAWTDAQ